MKKKFIIIIGIALVIAGIVLLAGGFWITGFAIFEEIKNEWQSAIGIALIISGIILLAEWREKEGRLEERTMAPERHVERKDAIKMAREIVENADPKENYKTVIADVADILVQQMGGERRTEYEQKDLNYLAKLIAHKYRIGKGNVCDELGKTIHAYKE